MHATIEKMLKKYNCNNKGDYLNALKEIIQEISLLALWRAKFYEKAAFYGGSALRILHGLDRFSEDLDFTLLKNDPAFELEPYNHAIEKELSSFGFEVNVESKIKNIQSTIESAFIKADAKIQLLTVEAPPDIIKTLHSMQSIKIKMEVDINPPGKFSTESRSLLQPIPFLITTLTLPDLFAGKIHALLCRPWLKRVKGRDWYDFIWYISNGTPVNLTHLQERLVQSGAWNRKNALTQESLNDLLIAKINTTNFSNAKMDISKYIKDQAALEIWSPEFFTKLVGNLKITTSPLSRPLNSAVK